MWIGALLRKLPAQEDGLEFQPVGYPLLGRSKEEVATLLLDSCNAQRANHGYTEKFVMHLGELTDEVIPPAAETKPLKK